MPAPLVDDAVARRRPFSPIVLWAGGALVAGAGVAAIVLESDAALLRSQLVASQGSPGASGTISQDDRQRFDHERTWAYAAVGGVSAFAAVTAGLAAWYIFGSSRSPVLVEAAVVPERGGLVAGAAGRF
jgi:hypothetical protein